jgi:hypothetical protein
MRERWLWLVVAGLVLWGGYQIWQVRRQIVGQLRRESSRHSKPAHSSKRVSTAPTSPFDSVPNPASPAPTPVPAFQLAPLTAAELHHAHQLYTQRMQLAQTHHLIAARFRLERAWRIVAGRQNAFGASIRRWLTKINTHTLLAGVAYPHDPWIRLIRVQPGATPERIAHLYRITPAMLLLLNPLLNPRDMRAGSWLLVILGPFNARISLAHGRVDLLIHHQFVLSYRVKIAGVISPAAGDYAVVRSALTAPVNGMPELISLTLAGRINDRRQTVKMSNVDSPSTDLVMSTQSLAELVRMLSPTFSVVKIRP